MEVHSSIFVPFCFFFLLFFNINYTFKKLNVKLYDKKNIIVGLPTGFLKYFVKKSKSNCLLCNLL